MLFKKKRIQIPTDFTTWLADSLNVLPCVRGSAYL